MAYKRISPMPVIEGGTGDVTLTNHTVLVGAGTGAITQITAGTTGQVLTGVTGADPSFQSPAASSISITGDTGGALTGAAFTFAGGTTGLAFGGSGSTETLTFAGITANAGVVNLGTDSTANAINIGTVSNTGRTITIGNTTLATGIVERVGTGNFSLDGAASSTYAIGASATTGTITLGGTSMSGALTLGQSAQTIFLNSSSNAASIRIGYNQTGGSIYLGHNMTTGTIEIGAGNAAQTGTISIAPGTGAQTVQIATANTGVKTVQIATGSVANIVSIGSTTGAASLTLSSGSGNIVSNAGLTVDSTGRMTNAVQPSFNVYLSANVPNVTGDGTGYFQAYDTEVFDRGNNFSSSIFTAPVTGIYNFSYTVACSNLSASTTSGIAQLVTTASNHLCAYMNYYVAGALNNIYQASGSWTVAMTAGDTAKTVVYVFNGTKTVSATGGQDNTSFSGFLVC